MRIAVLTPASDYAGEWLWAYEPQAEALRAAGADIVPLRWTKVGGLDDIDLVAPLVAWGYHQDQARWFALLDSLARAPCPIANHVSLLRWSSDKAYLAELAENGVATIPTLSVESLDEQELARARDHFGARDLVVKPSISASAYGTHRLRADDAFPEAVRGWRMLVQPWIDAITDSGEYSLIYFDDQFSHAVSKVPVPGEFRVQPEYGGIIRRCEPPAGSLELARAALDVAPARSDYARVDIVVGNAGELQIIELELIEPALFLAEAPDASAAFARAMVSAAERAGEQPLADGRSQVRRPFDVQPG